MIGENGLDHGWCDPWRPCRLLPWRTAPCHFWARHGARAIRGATTMRRDDDFLRLEVIATSKSILNMDWNYISMIYVLNCSDMFVCLYYMLLNIYLTFCIFLLSRKNLITAWPRLNLGSPLIDPWWHAHATLPMPCLSQEATVPLATLFGGCITLGKSLFQARYFPRFNDRRGAGSTGYLPLFLQDLQVSRKANRKAKYISSNITGCIRHFNIAFICLHLWYCNHL